MIFEERRISLRKGAASEYVQFAQDALADSLAREGGRILCLLGGLIGDPPDELLQFARYPDLNAWERAQQLAPEAKGDVVERSDTRLLRAVSARPKPALPISDRRALYGYRRFFVRGSDLDEFIHCSADGVWPRIEAQGASILGLWTLMASGEPREAILLTGYHSPTHWDSTRS